MILNRFAVLKSPTHKLTDCYKFNGIKWGNWKIEYLKMKKWELQSLCKTNFKHFNWNKKTCDFYPINRIYSVSMLLQRKKINFFGWWVFLSVSFLLVKLETMQSKIIIKLHHAHDGAIEYEWKPHANDEKNDISTKCVKILSGTNET